MIGGCSEELSDEDDELCPVSCVREFKNDNDFLRILEKAKETKSLVVVNFYWTAANILTRGLQSYARDMGSRKMD